MSAMKEKWFDEWWTQYGADKPLWHEASTPESGKSGDSRKANNGFWDVCDCSECESLGLDTTSGSKRPSAKTVKYTGMSEDMVWSMEDIFDELYTILEKKYADYGPTNILTTPGGALQGIAVRLYDKIARLDNLSRSGNLPENEPLRDTLIDIANYAVIGLMVQEGTWGK